MSAVVALAAHPRRGRLARGLGDSVMSAFRVAVVAALFPATLSLAAPPQRYIEPKATPVIDPAVELAPSAAGGKAARVWVFFTDKGVYSDDAYAAAIEQAAATFTPRAVERRERRRSRPDLFDFDDLPVDESFVDAVVATGARLRVRSRWLNAVSVEADRGRIEAIAALPFVRWIYPLSRSAGLPEPVRLGSEANESAAGVPPLPHPPGAADFYGNTSAQLHQINIPPAHQNGFTGDGVIIGVLDTGFHRGHEAYNFPDHPLDMLGEWDFINNDNNTGKQQGDPGSQHWHGTAVLSTIAGYNPNVFVGGAYDASFYLAKTEDISREVPIEEDFYVAGLEWFESHGVDMATSSLGYIDWYEQRDLDGRTAVTTKGVNVATANGMACCTAAGNEGHDNNPNVSHLLAPADAFEVLACGAVSSEGSIVGFSSDGPTADGRTKPEVLALGARTACIDPNNDRGYTTASGTSLSTPLVACGTALVIDAHPDWSVKQIRASLLRTASDYVRDGRPDPLYIRGYGLIDVWAAINVTFIGDIDRDGDTDLRDHARFVECMEGPGVEVGPECEAADLDDDRDVDVKDFAAFEGAFTGRF